MIRRRPFENKRNRQRKKKVPAPSRVTRVVGDESMSHLTVTCDTCGRSVNETYYKRTRPINSLNQILSSASDTSNTCTTPSSLPQVYYVCTGAEDIPATSIQCVKEPKVEH